MVSDYSIYFYTLFLQWSPIICESDSGYFYTQFLQWSYAFFSWDWLSLFRHSMCSDSGSCMVFLHSVFKVLSVYMICYILMSGCHVLFRAARVKNVTELLWDMDIILFLYLYNMIETILLEITDKSKPPVVNLMVYAWSAPLISRASSSQLKHFVYKEFYQKDITQKWAERFVICSCWPFVN